MLQKLFLLGLEPSRAKLIQSDWSNFQKNITKDCFLAVLSSKKCSTALSTIQRWKLQIGKKETNYHKKWKYICGNLQSNKQLN